MADMRPEIPGSDDDRLEASETGPPGERREVKRLYRSSEQRILLGVCGGLGEYFDVDPTLVRILVVILTLAGAAGLLLYIVLAAIMPASDQLDAHPRDAARATFDEAVAGSQNAVTRATDWLRSLAGRGRNSPGGRTPPP